MTAVPARTCAGVGTIDDPADLPPAISRSALEKRCPECVETLDMFVTAYGAEPIWLSKPAAEAVCNRYPPPASSM